MRKNIRKYLLQKQHPSEQPDSTTNPATPENQVVEQGNAQPYPDQSATANSLLDAFPVEHQSTAILPSVQQPETRVRVSSTVNDDTARRSYVPKPYIAGTNDRTVKRPYVPKPYIADTNDRTVKRPYVPEPYIADAKDKIIRRPYQRLPLPPARPESTQASIVDHETIKVAAVSPVAMPSRVRKGIGYLPAPLRYIAGAVYLQCVDPNPEVLPASVIQSQAVVSPRIQEIQLGWLPAVTLISATGLFVVSYAYNISRFLGLATLGNFALIEAIFLFGLLLIFSPAIVRLLSPSPMRLERIGLLCVVGLSLYLVQVTNSPLHFTNFDEFLHLRTAADIARTGHFYSENTILPVSPYYPGLEIVTNALTSLTGLQTFYAGLIELGIARLLIVLSLFLLFEQATKSARIASIATAIYMTNPHFIFFDAQYSYESLALPIAAFLLFIVSRLDTLPYKHRLMTFTAWLVLAAIALTHHVTNYVFDGFLLLWMITYHFQRPVRSRQLNLAVITFWGVVVAVAVVFIPGNPVISYLSSYFGESITNLVQVFAGSSRARTLFVDTSGLPSPVWDHLLIAASVGIITLALPFGLLCVWQRHRFNGLALMFAITVFGYPISQAFRFTSFGSEITDRSAAYLFIPVAFVLAILITQFWPTRQLTWKNTSLITCIVSIVFLGGVILQSGPGLSALPGPYLVSADNRSVDPQSIQDALWTYAHLGPDNRIASDRINRLLLSVYGQQYAITHLADNVDYTPIFFDPSVGAKEIQIMRNAHMQYLIVDLRLSTNTPLVGIYYQSVESSANQYRTPVPRSDLTKFNGVPQLNREFDSGDIVIYDVKGLVNAP